MSSPTSPTVPDKDALRRQARATLKALDATQMAAASGQIVARLQSLELLRGAPGIATYAAWRREPDLDALTAWAASTGIPVYYPRYEAERDRYRLGRVWAVGELRRGHHGIREPLPTAPEPTSAERQALAWLVPGLGFDAAGNRLGRGAGDYDRLLAGCRGPRVGVCFAAQVLPAVPRLPHDVPMHAVVTESTVHVAETQGATP